MKRFHPALVALTIIGSSVVATTTRAEAQDTAYQGYVPGYNYGFAPEYSYFYATDYNYAYARPYYRYGYSRPYHYRHAHPYRYQYAGLHNYRYAHPYAISTREPITTATRTPTAIGTLVTGTRAHHYRVAGPGCLNSFSASISGASAGVRLPSGEAAA